MAQSPALRFDYFTSDANEVAAHAYDIARLYGHQAVDVEHFALALLEKPGRALPKLFSNLGIDTKAVSDQLDALVQALPTQPAESPDKIYITLRTQSIIDVAGDETHHLREDKIDNVHLLLAIVSASESPAAHVLAEAGVSRRRLLQAYERSNFYAPQRPMAAPASAYKAVGNANTAPTQNRTSNFRQWLSDAFASVFAFFGRIPGIELSVIPVTISPVFSVTFVLMMLTGFVTYFLSGATAQLTGFIFVTCGWFLGLALHEFGHALAAYQNGDWSVTGSPYFNLNPFKYTFLLNSLIFPALFYLVFRIGLPGMPLFVGFHNISTQRGRNWAWAGGAIASGICGLIFGLPYVLRIQSFFPTGHEIFWNSLASIAVLQLFTMLISLFPLPGLDGFGILEPYLPERVLYYVNIVRPYMFIIFLVFFLTPLRLLFDIPFGIVLWITGFNASPF